MRDDTVQREGFEGPTYVTPFGEPETPVEHPVTPGDGDDSIKMYTPDDVREMLDGVLQLVTGSTQVAFMYNERQSYRRLKRLRGDIERHIAEVFGE